MSRLPIAVAILAVVAAFCTVAAILPAQQEEVRLLKLRVADLEKQVSELQTSPVLPPGVSRQPPLSPGMDRDKLPAGTEIIEAPPVVSPAPLENYDTGLYIWPGLEPKGVPAKGK